MINIIRAKFRKPAGPMFTANTPERKEEPVTPVVMAPKAALEEVMPELVTVPEPAAELKAAEPEPAVEPAANQASQSDIKTVHPSNTFVVRNTSKSGITNLEAWYMASASGALLGELAREWGRIAPTVMFRAGDTTIENERTFVLDGPDGNVAHTFGPRETRVYCGSSRNKIPTLLDEEDTSGPTIAKRLFFLMGEELMNPTHAHPIDIWSPVRDSSVIIEVAELPAAPDKWIKVSLCNYVYPAWWRSNTGDTPLDRAGVLGHPKTKAANTSQRVFESEAVPPV